LHFVAQSDSIPLIMAKTATKEGALAVIATGGKQYVVHEGTTVSIEKLDGVKEGDTVTFDQVLLVDTGTAKVGMPTVAGAKVTAKVTEIGRAKKVEIVRYRQKSRYFKKNGHRQPFVKVQIEKIAA
jgi:large subunit ribosomal protein L21